MPNSLSTPKQTILEVDLHRFAKLIPDKAADRLPQNTIKTFEDLLKRKGIADTIIDIHYHAFTHQHIPGNYLRNATWLKPAIVKSYLQLLRKDFFTSNKLKSSKQITDQLFDIYQKEHPQTLSHIFGGLLLMDMERAIDGAIESGFEKQILEAEKLLASEHQTGNVRFKYKDYILPFLALDPHNPDLFKQFCAAFIPKSKRPSSINAKFNAIFHGVKVYPALGYLPYHPALMEIFKICEQKKIPVTAHCGGIRTHPSKEKIIVQYLDQQYKKKEKDFLIKDDKINGKAFSEFFVRPEHWERVLNKYPKLKLNIAHMGNNKDWLEYRKGERNGTVERTFNLIKKYDHVFADLSYSFYLKVNVAAIYQKLKDNPDFSTKVMYGSDYYMCQVEKGTLNKYYRNIITVFSKDPDLYDKVFVKNAIAFLS